MDKIIQSKTETHVSAFASRLSPLNDRQKQAYSYLFDRTTNNLEKKISLRNSPLQDKTQDEQGTEMQQDDKKVSGQEFTLQQTEQLERMDEVVADGSACFQPLWNKDRASGEQGESKKSSSSTKMVTQFRSEKRGEKRVGETFVKVIPVSFSRAQGSQVMLNLRQYTNRRLTITRTKQMGTARRRRNSVIGAMSCGSTESSTAGSVCKELVDLDLHTSYQFQNCLLNGRNGKRDRVDTDYEVYNYRPMPRPGNPLATLFNRQTDSPSPTPAPVS